MRTRRTGSMTVDKEIATIEKLPLSEDCFVIFTVRLQRVAVQVTRCKRHSPRRAESGVTVP